MRLPESGWGAANGSSTRPATPSVAAASRSSLPSRPSTAPGLRRSGSRPASRGAPSVAASLERPGTAGPGLGLGATGGDAEKKKKPTKMFTYRRASPLPQTPPPGKPQSAAVVARLARAEKKRQELNSLYVDRDPARAAAGQEAPPWWSEKVHGKTGESLMESQLGPKSKPAEDEPLNVRSSLEVLRSSLGTLPWSDGRPVLDPNRRMRVEVSEVEEEMREHLWRYCTAVRKKYKSPCISEYQYLTKVFSDYDKAKMPKLEGQAKVETTGDVSVREFLDIWNNEIRLYRRQKLRDPESGILVCAKIVTDENGKEVFEKPSRGEEVLLPFKLTEAHGAAIFCKYGYNKDGLMPYDVFCRSIFTPPARKLGMEPLLNNKAKGLDGFGPKDDPGFDGKIIYSKSRKGVFSPTDFDPLLALRSSKAPTASMQLDWVHGYAGVKNVANNLHYNAEGDVVYYTAAVCIVYNIKRHEQRHFFGHNEEIACLGAHPGKELFASGQWKAAGPTEVPYACIWDSTTMQEVQRIGHPRDNRGVIALAFSPGEGRHLITCTGDNQHTLFVWDWNAKPRDRSKPASWHYGPPAKLATLQESPTGFFFQSAVPPCPPSRAPGAPAPGELRPGRFKPGTEAPELGVAYSTQHHGITALQGWDYRRGKKVTEASATASGNLLNKDGLKARKLSQMFFDPKNKEAWKVGDGSYELLCEPMNAVNGLPPALFGIVFNLLDASDMCEFVTYGVKHIKMVAVARGGRDVRPGERRVRRRQRLEHPERGVRAGLDGGLGHRPGHGEAHHVPGAGERQGDGPDAEQGDLQGHRVGEDRQVPAGQEGQRRGGEVHRGHARGGAVEGPRHKHGAGHRVHHWEPRRLAAEPQDAVPAAADAGGAGAQAGPADRARRRQHLVRGRAVPENPQRREDADLRQGRRGRPPVGREAVRGRRPLDDRRGGPDLGLGQAAHEEGRGQQSAAGPRGGAAQEARRLVAQGRVGLRE